MNKLFIILIVLLSLPIAYADFLPGYSSYAAEDDFESGTFSGGENFTRAWNYSPSADVIMRTNVQPYEGIKHVQLRKTSRFTRMLNLTDWYNPYLEVATKVSSIEAGEYASIWAVRPNGTAYLLTRLGESRDTNQWYLEGLQLDAFENSGLLNITFRINGSTVDDSFEVDYVEVYAEHNTDCQPWNLSFVPLNNICRQNSTMQYVKTYTSTTSGIVCLPPDNGSIVIMDCQAVVELSSGFYSFLWTLIAIIMTLLTFYALVNLESPYRVIMPILTIIYTAGTELAFMLVINVIILIIMFVDMFMVKDQ